MNIEILFEEHVHILKEFISNNSENLKSLSVIMINALEAGNKILIAGNGGSASSSAHMTAELVGRFEKERKSLAAICMSSDLATITAIANDYGYEFIFSKQIESIGKPEDILIGISTSGKSPNIIKAMQQAESQGLTTVLWTGSKGINSSFANIVIAVPSERTARIQECHDFAVHYLAGLIEDHFFNKQ